MTRRTKVLVLVIAGAVVIAAMLIGAVAVVGWQIGRQAKPVPDPTPLTEADKRLLLTAADVARLVGPAVEPGAENWSSLRQGNATRFILYLYQPKDYPFSMYSRLVVLAHPAGARSMYQADKLMMKLGRPDGVSYVPAPGLFPEGGDRSAWFIEQDGDRIGNFFLIREGRFLQSVKLTGLTLHRPADVRNLLGPMLSEAKRRASMDGGSER